MSSSKDNYKDLLKKIDAKNVCVKTSFNICMASLMNDDDKSNKYMIFSNVFLGTVLKSCIEQHFKDSFVEFCNMGYEQSITVGTSYKHNNHKDTLRFVLVALSMAKDFYAHFITFSLNESIKNMEILLNKTRLNEQLVARLEDEHIFSDVLKSKQKI